MSRKKKYTTDNGSRCSGYGVYPDGAKCKGCSDCKGRFLKKAASAKQLRTIFNSSHAIVTITNKKTK